jgi:hypothetical protein
MTIDMSGHLAAPTESLLIAPQDGVNVIDLPVLIVPFAFSQLVVSVYPLLDK